MISRRFALAFTSATVCLAFASAANAATPRQRQERRAPVVVRGVVAATELPARLFLEDGREINLPAPDLVDAFTPAPGDEIVAIGSVSAAGSTVIVRAGSARVVRSVQRSRMTVPTTRVLCAPPASVLDLAGPTASVSPVAAAELMRSGDMEIMGTVISVAASSFMVHTETQGDIQVIVDSETELVGITSVSDLGVGDKIRARGTLSGSVLTASRVELMEKAGGGPGDGGGGGSSGPGPGVGFESTGAVIGLQPPDRFSLNDGHTYRVDVDTTFEGSLASYEDLAVGQFLEVRAAYSGSGEYRAVRIDLEGDMGHGQGYRELDGSVQVVDQTGLTLDDGTVVLFMPSTVFNGDADRWQDIQPGWDVQIDALLNMMGDLLAMEVRAEDPAPATATGQEFEPHEALLVLAEGADPDAVAARHGASVEGSVGSLGVLFRWGEEIDDNLLAQVTADADVLAVEPNYLFRDPESSRKRFPVVDRSPTEEKFTDQAAVTQIQLGAAALVSDGTGTVVAILDTGVDPCNPLLEGRILAGGLDTVDGDMSPWETRDGVDEDGDGDIDEAAGHGSFVASMVALAAPGARILPYRVLDDDGGGTAYDLALALADAIDRGVDVINLSLTYQERSTVVDLLLEKAAARGIVVVASAGNEADTTLPFPAVDSHVLAVTALAADGTTLASFANRSQQAALAAPGEDLYGALDRGQLGTWSGTSMAAPLAAAGAALLKSLDKSVDPAIVRLALTQGGPSLTDRTWSGVTLDLAGTLELIAP